MQELASNIIVRNVEIHDIGYSRGSGSGTAPNGAGVRLGGHDILFERVIIHDNCQDAFQAGFGVWNFTLRNSWLYNSLEHPIEPGKSFNYCSHTDGIQIYGGGQQGPVLVEDSLIGPSFTQGIIIGSKATVDDVVIRNTLFVGSDNAGIIISDGGQSSNWILQNFEYTGVQAVLVGPDDDEHVWITRQAVLQHFGQALQVFYRLVVDQQRTITSQGDVDVVLHLAFGGVGHRQGDGGAVARHYHGRDDHHD